MTKPINENLRSVMIENDNGILQPLLVRPWTPGMALPRGACFGDMVDHFELIAGERRWGAAQAAIAGSPASIGRWWPSSPPGASGTSSICKIFEGAEK